MCTEHQSMCNDSASPNVERKRVIASDGSIDTQPSLHYGEFTHIHCTHTLCVHSLTIGCPSERAMVLAHIQKKGFMDVIRNTGIRGLYHGFEATIYRDISFNMAFFTIREIFVRVYRNHYGTDPNPFQRTLMGIISGTMASVFACPFDVVKTRIQGKDLKSASGEVVCGLCVHTV